MNTEKSFQYLEHRPGSLYRQPYVKGIKMRAEIPYSATVEKIQEDGSVEPGMTPEEVAADYNIPLGAVLEAIEWCREHWDVVMADHASEERLVEAHGMNHPEYKTDPKKYYKHLSVEEMMRILQDEPLPG